MKYQILTGNEPYLLNQYIAKETKNHTVVRSNVFTSEEIVLVRQLSIFGANAIVIEGDLSKEQEAELYSMIDGNVDINGLLFYVPTKVDARKKIFKLQQCIVKFTKPSVEEVFKILIEECNANMVPYKTETLQYMLDYSEYFEEDSISLYDLIGVIRSTSGNEVNKEHINNSIQRSSKDNAFELIKLISKRDELIDYMNRLSSNPYQVIGALNYAFRLMAKLKLSENIGISNYQKKQYRELSERWEYSEIVSKLKMFNSLRQTHETKEVARALILTTLLE